MVSVRNIQKNEAPEDVRAAFLECFSEYLRLTENGAGQAAGDRTGDA